MNNQTQTKSVREILSKPQAMSNISMRMKLEQGEQVKLHESEFRSFHILEKVKELLQKELPGKVVLEMIEVLQTPESDPLAMRNL